MKHENMKTKATQRQRQGFEQARHYCKYLIQAKKCDRLITIAAWPRTPPRWEDPGGNINAPEAFEISGCKAVYVSSCTSLLHKSIFFHHKVATVFFLSLVNLVKTPITCMYTHACVAYHKQSKLVQHAIIDLKIFH